MRFRSQGPAQQESIELEMTPMIDVVFQLLVFFVFSMKIVSPEGDFNVKMPLASATQVQPVPSDLPPLRLRMVADEKGALTAMQLNDQPFQDFQQLHQHIVQLIGNERGPGSFQEQAEIELDCDQQLRYEYVIRAITAVSGMITADHRVVKLIEKINFAPPR